MSTRSLFCKNFLFLIISAFLFSPLQSCDRDADTPEYVPPHSSDETSHDTYLKQTEFEGVNPSGLKILAIGNSFTENGTRFLPWILDRMDVDDEVFIATLYLSGASLQTHWENHVADRSDYVMHYSHGGEWHEVSGATIDQALQVFDWDIVVMQQSSVYAGLTYTYQPYLQYLQTLVRDTNTSPKLVWQYTWAFTPEATWHADFKKYFQGNPQTMYDAVISTCDRMSADFDLRIPSGQFVKMLRDRYPEQKDGFSLDGVHLTDPGCFALSCLWNEVLLGDDYSSCLYMTGTPDGISQDFSDTASILINEFLTTF